MPPTHHPPPPPPPPSPSPHPHPQQMAFTCHVVASDWIQSYLAICKMEFNSFLLMIVIPGLCLLNVGSPRDQSWAHYCFLSMSTILIVFFQYYLPYIPNLITVMNNELLKLSETKNVNKLSLNVKKTKYMLFCIKKPHIEGGNMLLNGEIVDKVNHFKFLGVIIDSHLSWMDHVQHIRKKISKGIGILYKTKDYRKSDTLLTFYCSFVYPYLIYCIEVWGATTKGNFISLLKTQKRVVRLIKSVSIRTESAPLFSELKMLSVFKIYVLKITVLMFKYHHGQVPNTIDYLFTKVNNVHDRDTRQSSQYYVPFTRK